MIKEDKFNEGICINLRDLKVRKRSWSIVKQRIDSILRLCCVYCLGKLVVKETMQILSALKSGQGRKRLSICKMRVEE